MVVNSEPCVDKQGIYFLLNSLYIAIVRKKRVGKIFPRIGEITLIFHPESVW
jgi:hypothetical protein